jgi:hypothetical protein
MIIFSHGFCPFVKIKPSFTRRALDDVPLTVIAIDGHTKRNLRNTAISLEGKTRRIGRRQFVLPTVFCPFSETGESLG